MSGKLWLLLVWTAALAGAALSPVAGQEAPPPGDLRQSIEAVNQKWIEAMKSADPAAIAETFLEDGVNLGADGAAAKGRPAIEDSMRAFFDRFGKASTGSVQIREVVPDADLAYERGSSDFFCPGAKGRPPYRRAGRYLTVWKRGPDGKWRIFRNIGLPSGP